MTFRRGELLSEHVEVQMFCCAVLTRIRPVQIVLGVRLVSDRSISLADI